MGRVLGFTLTLDGYCEGCWSGGKPAFKQTVKSIREQLKEDMLNATSQESFFAAYSKAKAAGVSENVVKKLCEKYQGRTGKRSGTPGLGNEQQDCSSIKRSRRRAPSEDTPSKAGHLLATVQVKVSVGLSGTEVAIDVDATLSLENLRSKVRQAYPAAGERFIKFSSGGVTVNSAEAMIKWVQDDEAICVTFLKAVDAMSLKELQQELAVGDDEFQGHLHVFRRYRATQTPADVARYLWQNQILLTAAQAQRIFDALVAKITRAPKPRSLGRDGPRAQLILALHSFCCEPYAIWEPNDDCDECLWANMRWGDDSRNCKQLSGGRYRLRGHLRNIPSSSSSSSSPSDQHVDVSRLRSVLNAQRDSTSWPLEAMMFPEAYEYSWRTLLDP